MRILALLLASLFAPAPACAQSAVEAFYKGRTVDIMVGTVPGGGYDLYGRLLAQHLAKHIPGHPTVIVKNMPGAGHLRMTNWLYNVAPKDGTVMAVAPQALAIEQALALRRHPVRRRQVHLDRPHRAGGRDHLHLVHVADQDAR